MAFELFVNGTLMRGLKLHPNMGDSEFLGEFRTAPFYRVHTINDVHPGMYRLFTIVEAVEQLTGRAGARQVAGAKLALAHGNGGELSSQVTLLLGTAETL